MFFRRNLPHYHVPNATYFVTFRLAGSLPMEVLQRAQEEYESERLHLKRSLRGQTLQEALRQAQETYFARLDALLDKTIYGPRWLNQPQYARLVMDCIRELEPAHYHLHAFCIMPNHVHLLLDQQGIPDPPPRRDGKAYTALNLAIRLLKSKSGMLCNRLLGQRGAFWQHESYDHVVRNAREFQRILEYIVNNPVQAGLVEDWQAWPYLYINQDL
ncbi:MAG: transposase [Anaerolineales bacterium]